MGPFIKAAGMLAAALLAQPGMAAVPSIADAQQVVFVPCSTAALISAINSNNNAEGRRTLRLAPRCSYTLSAVAAISGNGANGLPIITGNITLTGGPDTRIVRGSAVQFRLIEVAGGGVLRVRGITLSGGNSTSTGGAIRNSGGTVSLSRTAVTGNRASDLGGGLDNQGPGRMVVVSSLIRGNTAASINGGGIFNDGTLSVSFSRFTGNNARGRGGGLRTVGMNSLAEVSRTTFDRNTAGIHGGGIAVGAFSTLTLTRSLVTRNSAAVAGGVSVDPGATFRQRRNLIRGNSPNDCVGNGCTGQPRAIADLGGHR